MARLDVHPTEDELRVPRAGTEQAGAGTGTGTGTDADAAPAPDLLGKLAAGPCFAAVVAAMVWGVVSIVRHR